MRRLVLLLVLASTPAAATPAVPIIGGTPATQNEFPNVVGLLIGTGDNEGICTGTLITNEWVMTAAHCVYPSEFGVSSQADITSSIRVYFGTLNLFDTSTTPLTAQDSVFDPMFAGTTSAEIVMGHDMGLIHLSTPVTGITPAALNYNASDAQAGLAVVQVGYGQTTGGDGSGGTVGVLDQVDQTVVNCTSADGGNNTMMLCFDQTDGKGKCEGDSGGPSFATIDGKTIEVSTTSYGDPDCAAYGVDTRTDFEKPFLLAHIPNLVECNSDSDCTDMKECFEHICIVQPFSPTGLGSTCTSGSNCDSGTCATDSSGGKCSMACTTGDDSTCPSGFDCISAGAGGTCWPSSGGCCDASGRGAPTALIGIALIGLVWRRRRASQ